MTHRGPFQLPPFCDSVNATSAVSVREEISVERTEARHFTGRRNFKTAEKVSQSSLVETIPNKPFTARQL